MLSKKGVDSRDVQMAAEDGCQETGERLAEELEYLCIDCQERAEKTLRRPSLVLG